ncbi:carbonyl reductase [NADPH] 1-like [Diprion similis]|uniref:carbonyl reductase [NADPH] 1-like n=1 Tax=Diprion similis TaxID=362088 RepID=UPI001EF93DA6|nr:carbonyl reductase [NADPH] 1-like [Diprion similis]
MSRVAVVTGGNKGIGLAIVKGLCQKFDGIVYLTARDETRGLAAVEQLKKEGLNPKFHQLDVTDDSSVNNFKKYLSDTYGGLDVLVNNAAIAFKNNATDPFFFQASETVKVNYFSLVRVCEALFPLLKPHARVVNLSSSAGHLSRIPGAELKARFANPDLTQDELNQIMNEFIEAAKTNSHQESGWVNSAYSASKVAVSALSRIQQKKFDKDTREDLVINAVHPGYVDTDMTSHKGPLTPERGAQAPIYLALLPKNTDIKGKYVWHDNTIIDWVNDTPPAPY